MDRLLCVQRRFGENNAGKFSLVNNIHRYSRVLGLNCILKMDIAPEVHF